MQGEVFLGKSGPLSSHQGLSLHTLTQPTSLENTLEHIFYVPGKREAPGQEKQCQFAQMGGVFF